MKKLFITAGVFSLVSLAVLGVAELIWYGLAKLSIVGAPAPFQVMTAYLIKHQGASPGNQIKIPLPSGSTFVHFPLATPCANQVHDLKGPNGGTVTCKAAAPITPYAAQYPFSRDMSPNTPPSVTESKCRSCCFMCQIVIANPKPDPLEVASALAGSGPTGAVEVLIDESYDSVPLPLPNPKMTVARSGQPVKWFRSGAGDLGWTIQFKDSSPCESQASIGSAVGQTKICTISPNAKAGSYTYTITVNGQVANGMLTKQ